MVVEEEDAAEDRESLSPDTCRATRAATQTQVSAVCSQVKMRRVCKKQMCVVSLFASVCVCVCQHTWFWGRHTRGRWWLWLATHTQTRHSALFPHLIFIHRLSRCCTFSLCLSCVDLCPFPVFLPCGRDDRGRVPPSSLHLRRWFNQVHH